MIRINFDEIYPPIQIGTDWSFMTFTTEDKNGKSILLKVEIVALNNPYLPKVHNLAFGPLHTDGSIDDKARIYHLSSDKVF